MHSGRGLVVEIPTRRWIAYERGKMELDPFERIPLESQDRVYASPIWYSAER